MIVEQVSGSAWAECPNGVESAIKAVQAGLQQVYREGFSYAKAQVMLLDLCRKNEYTPDLFAPEQPVKTERLMSTLDAINNRWGHGTLQPGRIAKPVEWGGCAEFCVTGVGVTAAAAGLRS